jgi:intracellular septation protein
MKFLFDMFPVILFFVVFKLVGIYEATAVAIAATMVQIGWVYFRHGKVEPMLWVSLGVIALFGGATIYLQNETFISKKT